MEKARDSRGLFQIISTQRPEWFEANIQKTKSGLRVCRVGAATTSLPDTQRCLRHTAHGWTKRWMKRQARMAATYSTRNFPNECQGRNYWDRYAAGGKYQLRFSGVRSVVQTYFVHQCMCRDSKNQATSEITSITVYSNSTVSHSTLSNFNN